MKGKARTDEERIKAMELLITMSVPDVSKITGIPENTLRNWQKGITKNSKKDSEDLVELRSEKRKEWAGEAWEVVGLGTTLLKRRLKRAVEQEDEIDVLLDNALDDIENDCDLTDAQKHRKVVSVSSKISALKVEDINKIAITVGTMYDKTALVLGEATSNSEIKIKLGKELDDLAD